MSQLVNALAGLNEDEVSRLTLEEINAGVNAVSILNELRRGMDIVGERYKTGEYFLSELIVSAEIFKDSMKVLEPLLKAVKGSGVSTKVVLGTVKGDIHNIGKDIVAILLRASGFDVYDVGIDAAPSAFLEKLIETKAPILGMSGLLTPSFESMRETVKAVEAAGIRNRVKIVIGGGIINEMAKRHVGADAFTNDGQEGVEICRRFAEEMKSEDRVEQ